MMIPASVPPLKTDIGRKTVRICCCVSSELYPNVGEIHSWVSWSLVKPQGLGILSHLTSRRWPTCGKFPGALILVFRVSRPLSHLSEVGISLHLQGGYQDEELATEVWVSTWITENLQSISIKITHLKTFLVASRLIGLLSPLEILKGQGYVLKHPDWWNTCRLSFTYLDGGGSINKINRSCWTSRSGTAVPLPCMSSTWFDFPEL